MPLEWLCVGREQEPFWSKTGGLWETLMDVGRRVSSGRHLARSPGTPSPALLVPRGDVSAQRTWSKMSVCNCGSRNPPGCQVSMTRPDWKGPFLVLTQAPMLAHPTSGKRPSHHTLSQGQAALGCSLQAS